jgi:hypothetical protein
MALLTVERDREDGERKVDTLPPGSSVTTGARWFLAACSFGAAVVHFGYSPSHFGEYWLYGLFFVVVAWLQLSWAVGVVLTKRRWLLLVGLVLNGAVMVVWLLSRTIGVWVGPNATVSEAVSFPDVLSTILEGLIVVGSGLLLARPRLLGRRVRNPWLTPLAAGSATLLIAGLAGYGLTPRFVGGHNHAAGGHDHAAGGLTGNTPCEQAGPPVSEGQVFNSAGHFHRGPLPQQPISEPTRLQLQTQQETARLVAANYPTVADAERAGYHESTVYVPCIGAHYTNVALAGAFDPAAPSELLYDGTAPASRIVGLSYLVYHPGGAPDGFAGPNDVWHQHTFNGGLCINGAGLVIGAESTSPAQCAAAGGRKVPLTDVWMLHDWVVPGFECSWGVFASECPELGGRIGGTPWDKPDPSRPPIPQD